MFFLSQNQTTYSNDISNSCLPPRGDNAEAQTDLCRNGPGQVEFSFDATEAGGPLSVNGCDYTFIRYTPCVPDQAISTVNVELAGNSNLIEAPSSCTAFQVAAKAEETKSKVIFKSLALIMVS